MWLFVGLGNPGDGYEHNRHNIGFRVIDNILKNNDSFTSFRSKYQGLITQGKIGGEKALLLKPMTFMNLSGDSVNKVAKYYKIQPEKIIIVHDELDIAAGQLKIKKGGGNAGHNGLKSIQACLGTPEFWRIRIGIGRPQKGGDVSNYVLSNFSKADEEWLEPLVENITKSLPIFVRQGSKRFEEKIKKAIKMREKQNIDEEIIEAEKEE